MKKSLLFLMLFLYGLVGFAQIDKSNTTVKAPGELQSPQAGQDSVSFVPLSGSHSLSNLKDPFKVNPEPTTWGVEEKEPFSMIQDNGLMTYQPKDFTPKAFREKEVKPEHRNDQYLGDFTTGGSYVELYCRDHEYVDGDRVRIVVNGKVVNNNVALGAGYTPIFVKLSSGLNSIEFEALNQGTSGPNTAELRVYDEQGQEVTRKEWNLVTGGKASMVVVKQ